jgi:hypothetical protein
MTLIGGTGGVTISEQITPAPWPGIRMLRSHYSSCPKHGSRAEGGEGMFFFWGDVGGEGEGDARARPMRGGCGGPYTPISWRLVDGRPGSVC